MKGLIQRVTQAKVYANDEMQGEIGNGLVLLLGVERKDTVAEADRLLDKVLRYRIFEGAGGRMNLSLLDVEGGLAIVSQFTLVADTEKGLRPGFSRAAEPDTGKHLYHHLVDRARKQIPATVTGIFGADMVVELSNRGPATFMLSV